MEISDNQIISYLIKKAKMKDRFVWQKKFERDLVRGVPLEEFTAEAEKKRHKQRMAEIERVKKRRQERALEKLQRMERKRARAKLDDDSVEKIELAHDNEFLIPSQSNKISVNDDPNDVVQQPKYSIRVLTGYEWNKYNRKHYDYDNPPPKLVQGYKFNLNYPHLLDKSKCPSYEIEKDDNCTETCLIRFHAGPPYQDIAFRILDRGWELSSKHGFKCELDGRVLQLHFKFKRFAYRR